MTGLGAHRKGEGDLRLYSSGNFRLRHGSIRETAADAGDTVTSVAGNDEQPLDPDDPRPLYEQAAARLRDQIASGKLTGRLDSEWMIAARYHVSRDTIRRALEILVKEGLVTATRGRGTFARRPAQRDG